MFNKKHAASAIKAALFALVIIAAAAYFGSLRDNIGKKQLDLAERSIARYTVQCYALEGFFPAELSYLEENYSLPLNRNKYIYHYKKIGDNILPQIYVFPIESE